MVNLRDIVRRRTLWIGFFAAILPLLFLLSLQYWWLTRLEETSALAGKAVLTNFLDAVITDVLYSYAPAAERALDVPASFFTENRLDRAAGHFRRKDAEGARRLFVVRFLYDDWGTMLFFNPDREVMETPPPSDETRAVTVACAPWKLLHSKAVEAEPARLVVEERDPANRIVLNPILDRNSRVVGVAGLILDDEYFRKVLLPQAVKASLEKLFTGEAQRSVTVSAQDGRGRVWFASDDRDTRAPEVSRPFSFVFTDLRLGVRSRELTPEQLAHASFAFNLTLSVLAAVLLTGGIGLALRTAAREVRLSRMKSDFVSNVSHELRTPLASIRVFGEFLKLGRATTPEKVKEYGAYIESESRRLTQLVNNILDFARIESGRRLYHFGPGDVQEVLSGTLLTFEARLRHEGFTIEYLGPDRPLPAAQIDPEALGQAFHNLLDNAVRYSGDSRWIGVGVAQADAEIVVWVRDRGIGIPQEERERIFDRFHRVGTSLVHDVRGSGLGLSIVHHIAQAHGGRVTVESEPGSGSCFTIHLPVAAAR